MGTINHDAVIVTSNDTASLKKIKNYIKKTDYQQRFIESGNTVNCYVTIVMVPDGSKEFWPASDKGDQQRQHFINFIEKENLFCDYVEVSFGEFGHEIKKSNCHDVYS